MNNDVKKFYVSMAADEALLSDFDKILKEVDEKNLPEKERNDLFDGKILELAKKKGFNFTFEDALAFNKELSSKYGELSNDELDQVAGGFGLGGLLPPNLVAYAVFVDPRKIINTLINTLKK